MALPMPPVTQSNTPKGVMDSDGMKKSMMAGMEGMHKMPMSGDTDKDFAMMKMHRQQNVDTAQMEIAQDSSPP